MRLWVSGLLLALLLTACSPDVGPSTPAPEHTRLYVHPSGVFSLSLPGSWSVGDMSDGTGLLVTLAPPGADRTMLTIYVVRLAAPLDDSSFAAALDAYLQAPANAGLTVVDRAAMGDGSWRVTGIRHTRQEARPVNIFMQRDGPFFSALEATVPSSTDAFTGTVLTLILNDYRVNTAADWPVGLVEAVPAIPENYLVAGGNLSFSGLATWTDDAGLFHISGRIANHAPYPLEQVRVRAALYDLSGAALAEQTGPVPGAVLLDGEYAPFDVRFDGGRPAGVTRYGLRAEAVQAGASLSTFVDPGSFDWDDRAEYDDAGRLHIRGTVWNVSQRAVYDTQGIITVFDADGQVIGYAVADIAPEALEPGGSIRFDAPLAGLGGEPARYLLVVQARSQP